MKYKLILITSISLLFFSCANSGLNGKTYFLLNTNFYDVDEYQLKFISDETVELRISFSANKAMSRLKTYKSDSEMFQKSTLLHYTYKNGILDIPDRKLTLSLKNQDNENLKANTGETFYITSIVEVDKEEKLKRIDDLIATYKKIYLR